MSVGVMYSQGVHILELLLIVATQCMEGGGSGGGGGGEAGVCARIVPPAKSTYVVGELIVPGCTMEKFSAITTITCEVNKSTNEARVKYELSGCSIEFTADREGLLLLSCTVLCNKTRSTYNMSLTVVAGTSSSTIPTLITPSVSSEWPKFPSDTPECAPPCEGGLRPGEKSWPARQAGTVAGCTCVAVILALIVITVVAVVVGCRKRPWRNKTTTKPKPDSKGCIQPSNQPPQA